MKKTAKWTIALISLVVVALAGVTLLVVLVDPFFQYHKPLKGFPYLLENQLTQNPGMAKNLEYDSVLLGSSMTLTFNTADFEKEMGLNTIKLSYNAAFPKDQDNILSIIEKHHTFPGRVFLGVDLLTYSGGVDTTAYPIPEYYYDDNLINDVSYWWNMDVLLGYIVKPILQNRGGDDFHTIYDKYYDESLYDREKVLEGFSPKEKAEEPVPADAYLDAVTLNMEQNILPYIERHPETEFDCFFPPYSVLFWYDCKQEGQTEGRFAEYEKLMELLLSYDNVRLFFFAGNEEIIGDLNHYRDYTHYSREISSYLTSCFATGECEVTKENYKKALQRLREYVEAYDYAGLGL